MKHKKLKKEKIFTNGLGTFWNEKGKIIKTPIQTKKCYDCGQVLNGYQINVGYCPYCE